MKKHIVWSIVLILSIIIAFPAGMYYQGTISQVENLQYIVKNSFNHDSITVSGTEDIDDQNTIEFEAYFKDIDLVNAWDAESDKIRIVIECNLEGRGYVVTDRRQVELIVTEDHKTFHLESAKIIDDSPIIVKRIES